MHITYLCEREIIITWCSFWVGVDVLTTSIVGRPQPLPQGCVVLYAFYILSFLPVEKFQGYHFWPWLLDPAFSEDVVTFCSNSNKVLLSSLISYLRRQLEFSRALFFFQREFILCSKKYYIVAHVQQV
eukprot:snap_masked-scaffold_18-processed-gene-6.39-mRNA-1 protein AED:1.00 eAED:1.00 QI:0/0/0/0/1/1/3/0/127